MRFRTRLSGSKPFSETVAAHPHDLDLLNSLAMAYMRQSIRAQAESVFRRHSGSQPASSIITSVALFSTSNVAMTRSKRSAPSAASRSGQRTATSRARRLSGRSKNCGRQRKPFSTKPIGYFLMRIFNLHWDVCMNCINCPTRHARPTRTSAITIGLTGGRNAKIKLATLGGLRETGRRHTTAA